jgi:branched-chain amino acid transport system ATP-binding protein
MLQVEGLTKNFGGLAAVNAVTLTIERGELAGLIGPNGAGKTTFFNLVTGYLKPTAGKVTFEGEDLTGKKPHTVASRGMIRSFQQDNVFAAYTALENLVLAAHLNSGINPAQTILKTRHARRREAEIRAKAHETLELVGIPQLADATAGAMAHGHKRMLGIALALMCEPKLLMLDEPLAGMNPVEVDDTLALVRKLWEGGLTILLIEHNMRAAMSICQRFNVLSFGRKIAEGTPDEIRSNPEVVKAYLGTAANVA